MSCQHGSQILSELKMLTSLAIIGILLYKTLGLEIDHITIGTTRDLEEGEIKQSRLDIPADDNLEGKVVGEKRRRTLKIAWLAPAVSNILSAPINMQALKYALSVAETKFLRDYDIK